MNQNKKKERIKVYLTKYNINSKLSDKEIEILKESRDGHYAHHKTGRYFRCPDYLPED